MTACTSKVIVRFPGADVVTPAISKLTLTTSVSGARTELKSHQDAAARVVDCEILRQGAVN